MSTSEELREALLDLEEARKKEALQRQMAEALLAGLRVLVVSKDPHALFTQLFDVMKKPLGFEAAFVLLQNSDGLFTPLTASNPVFADSVWKPGAMLKRVLDGHPVAVFSTRNVEEWTAQPEAVHRVVNSALHFSLRTAEQRAIMVCTHSKRGHFSNNHVILARRFSMLATQALQKLESEERLADLKRKLESEAIMSELNRKLVENEQRLATAKRMETVGLLAGGVAHDLNNILTGIVSYPELLLMDDLLTDEQRQGIEAIRDAGLRAAAVVADLLTVAKGVAGPKEVLNLNSIIDDYMVSPEYRQLLHTYDGVSVKADPEKDLLNILGSRIHITKGIMNLACNAVEAAHDMTEGRVYIRTENRYLEIPLRGYKDVNPGEYVVLSVRDNGKGVLPADLDRIFEPFYTKKTMERSGTGLGLTIVWNVMEDHQGYVDVSSDENGTEFSLYFPAVRQSVSDSGESFTFTDYRGEGETVLVVDDLEGQRKIVCAMLTQLGYRPDSVESGEKAVEYLKDHSVDVVILDMIMDPGMNGLETYRRIGEIRPRQKAVISSGYSLSRDVVEAQQLGAGPFLRKPYTLVKLGQALREVLKG